MILDVCIDLWFIVDIVINFRTAYKSVSDFSFILTALPPFPPSI